MTDAAASDWSPIRAGDEALAALGHKRRVVASTTHFSAVPFLLGGSDAVATMPRHAAMAIAARTGLHLFACPIAIPRHAVEVGWRSGSVRRGRCDGPGHAFGAAGRNSMVSEGGCCQAGASAEAEAAPSRFGHAPNPCRPPSAKSPTAHRAPSLPRVNQYRRLTAAAHA
jgi:hypothetical protein